MDVYKEDLKKVKVELNEVEVLLQELLERQSSLLQQKENLEKIIQEQEDAASAKFANQDWDKTDFPWSEELERKMKDVFKLRKLRPMQLQTMNMTMAGKDCILIMPTGGGKSLCFQLPAVVSKGITLVISPLISLMEDQLMALAAIGVEATTLNSSSTPAEVKSIQEAMTDQRSGLKLLYVTPEKLAKSKRFMNKLEKMYQGGRFSRLVIDEVHCCSQWGHDFRPDYKFLGIMKRQFPEVPILGLTATATVNVLEDVKKILNIPRCHLFRASFNRPNLYYQVRAKPATQVEVMDEIQKVIKSQFNGESGIVYCFSKKDAEEVTLALQSRGIRSGCYHANLSSQERSRIHKMWSIGQILVVVATIAFGMGIDKPNVRFVIHHSISKSMENLYQESGRAGRDEGRSHCVVFYRLADVFRQSTMVFTEQTGLKCLYGILDYCLDTQRCRRAMIAKHFGETWDSSQCSGMCDRCDPNSIYTSTTMDITTHCKNILSILKQASDTDQRVTALKLVDSLLGKGQSSLRVKDIKGATLSREKAEKIVGFMLLKGYLKEDFHFTAYSTISYILPGHKASMVLNGNHQVSCNFQIKALGVTKSPKSGKSSSTSVSKSSTKASKSSKSSPSSSVTSSKSATTSSKKSANGVTDSKSNTVKDEHRKLVLKKETNSVNPKTEVPPSVESKNNNSKVKKRKPVVVDTDDDLDFSESCTTPKKKQYKPNPSKGGKPALESISKGNNSSINGGDEDRVPICIEDSDSDFET